MDRDMYEWKWESFSHSIILEAFVAVVNISKAALWSSPNGVGRVFNLFYVLSVALLNLRWTEIGCDDEARYT